MLILAINPGSTSTKLAIYDGDKKLWEKNISYSINELSKYKEIIDQLEWRQKLIKRKIKAAGFRVENMDAVVARGGAGLDPITGGTYLIDEEMLKDLKIGKNAKHASNLAGIIAYNLVKDKDIPAFTVDPVSVDEFESIARLSGFPEIIRRCQSHALNLKAVARNVAEKLDTEMNKINLIGVHLGGGISIAAMKKGRIIDVNNANQNGPYSPERSGTLPVLDLVEYIFSNNFDKNELKKKLIGKGGMVAYLGTNDGREIEKRISNGNKKAELVYKGMIYQIAKEIGAMAAVLEGNIDGIFVTGGLAYSDYLINSIKKYVEWIAPIMVFPGAEEMKHLVKGVYRVLNNKEKAKVYKDERINLEDLL